MKRTITVIITAAVLSTTPALADVDNIMKEYNENTILTSATKLSGDPEITTQDGRTMYDFRITDNVIVSITERGGEIRLCSVICKDESEAAEFLAQCAASASVVAGFDSFFLHGDILDLFLKTRAGKTYEQHESKSLGVVYQLTKEKFGYLFMIAR
jgi:hypothetical protein